MPQGAPSLMIRVQWVIYTVRGYGYLEGIALGLVRDDEENADGMYLFQEYTIFMDGAFLRCRKDEVRGLLSW